MIPTLRIAKREYIAPENDTAPGTIAIEIEVLATSAMPHQRYVFEVQDLSAEDMPRAMQQCEDQAISWAHAAYKQDFGVECAIGV